MTIRQRRELLPWERQPGEHINSYQMFTQYRDMVPHERSLKAIAQTWHRKVDTIREQYKRNNWMQRVTEFDEHIESLKDERRSKALIVEADKWAQRQLQVREEEFSLFLKINERVHAMLDFPLATVTKKDGGNTVIINPSKWFMGDAAKLAAIMSQVGRLSTEMETSRQKIESEVTHEIERILGLLEKSIPKDQFDKFITSLAGTTTNEDSQELSIEDNPRIRPFRKPAANL